MNKVEVFKMTEYADDRMHEVSFCEDVDPFVTPNRGLSRDMDISRYPVRTIHQVMGISAMLPEEHRLKEINRLSMMGYTLRNSDPYLISMIKEKKFIIADKDIDSAFEDVEKNNHLKDESRTALNHIIISMTHESNKLRHEKLSQQRVIDNYREEYCNLENRYSHLKSMNLFQRIFQWKKACNGK